MKVGYARVSTDDQKLDLQVDALRKAGCDRLFIDKGLSGVLTERPGLEQALQALGPGDTLVVWRLDRLGRSIANLIQMMDGIGKREIHFQSLTENIDTASSGGRLLFHMMAALAEFERSLISERTKAGMAAARKKGQHVGRPPSLQGERLHAALRAIKETNEPTEKVAARFGVSSRTLRRHLENQKRE